MVFLKFFNANKLLRCYTGCPNGSLESLEIYINKCNKFLQYFKVSDMNWNRQCPLYSAASHARPELPVKPRANPTHPDCVGRGITYQLLCQSRKRKLNLDDQPSRQWDLSRQNSISRNPKDCVIYTLLIIVKLL